MKFRFSNLGLVFRCITILTQLLLLCQLVLEQLVKGMVETNKEEMFLCLVNDILKAVKEFV